MRQTLLSFFALLTCILFTQKSFAQNFVNGDFELNTGFCIINAANPTITANLTGANAYGLGNEIDLMDNGCGYGTAYSGNFFLCLANSSSSTPDAITMQLDALLVAGNAYTISYHDRGYDVYGCCPPGVPLEVGVSTTAGTQGTVVYTSPTPTTNVWSLRTVNFVAPVSGGYISFQAQNNNTRWTHIDSIKITTACAINVTPAAPVICFGDSVQLSATGALSYSWSPLADLTFLNDSTVIASPDSTTTYTLIGDATACIDTIMVTVTVNPLPLSPFTIVPDTACVGTDVTITYTGDSLPAATYNWDFGGGIITSGSAAGPYEVHWDSGGSFIVSLSVTDNGCTSLPTTNTVTIFPPPTPSFIIAPPEICAGEQVLITYNGNASSTAIYNWSFGNGSIISGTGQGPYVVQYDTAGNQVVTLTVSEHGCPATQTDTLVIDSVPVVAFVVTDTSGCDTLSVQFVNLSTGGIFYLWDFGDGTLDTAKSPVKTFGIGTYTVSLTVTSANGCVVTLTIPGIINVYESPIAQFTVDPPANVPVMLRDAFFQFTNNSVGASTYYWDFGDTTSSDETDPSHQYILPGNYIVTLWAYNGICFDSASLKFIMVDHDPSYFIPSAFTPNGDGINDYFSVIAFQVQAMDISIFNRWGQLVFYTTDPDHGWDGTYNGIAEEIGTYVYLVNFVYITGETATAKGSVTLIR